MVTDACQHAMTVERKPDVTPAYHATICDGNDTVELSAKSIAVNWRSGVVSLHGARFEHRRMSAISQAENAIPIDWRREIVGIDGVGNRLRARYITSWYANGENTPCAFTVAVILPGNILEIGFSVDAFGMATPVTREFSGVINL